MNAKLFKLFILCAVCLIFSCNRSWYEVRDMEQLLGTRLRGSVSFLDRQEEWVNLNGDGEKGVLFNVLDATALSPSTHTMLPYDSATVEQRFSQSPLYPHLKQTAGYYIDKQEDDQQQSLFYDTVGSRLVYYLSIM